MVTVACAFPGCGQTMTLWPASLALDDSYFNLCSSSGSISMSSYSAHASTMGPPRELVFIDSAHTPASSAGSAHINNTLSAHDLINPYYCCGLHRLQHMCARYVAAMCTGMLQEAQNLRRFYTLGMNLMMQQHEEDEDEDEEVVVEVDRAADVRGRQDGDGDDDGHGGRRWINGRSGGGGGGGGICSDSSCTKRLLCCRKLWCSRQHYLNWLQDFYQHLQPQQICHLPGCASHVLVEEAVSSSYSHQRHRRPRPRHHPPNTNVTGTAGASARFKVHRFCSWGHAQKAYMMAGLAASFCNMTNRQIIHHDGFVSDDGHGLQTSIRCRNYASHSDEPCRPSSMVQAEPSIASVISALRAYLLHRCDLPRNVRIDDLFFTKHPWEVLTHPGDESCVLIAKCIWKGKTAESMSSSWTWTRGRRSMRQLVTKEGYHWKQQGKPIPHHHHHAPATPACITDTMCIRRYLTYCKLAGSSSSSTSLVAGYKRNRATSGGGGGGEHLNRSSDSFYLVEYTLVHHPPTRINCNQDDAGNNSFTLQDYCVVKLHRGKLNVNAASIGGSAAVICSSPNKSLSGPSSSLMANYDINIMPPLIEQDNDDPHHANIKDDHQDHHVLAGNDHSSALLDQQDTLSLGVLDDLLNIELTMPDDLLDISPAHQFNL